MLYIFLKNREYAFLLNCLKDDNSRLVKRLYNHKKQPARKLAETHNDRNGSSKSLSALCFNSDETFYYKY